jgi:hypothetical protein
MIPKQNAWHSIFGMNVLSNSNIRNPANSHEIKFRRRDRAPFALFVTSVDIFRSRRGWNPAYSDRYNARTH